MTWRRRIATLLRRLAEFVDDPVPRVEDDFDDDVFGVPGGWGGA